MKNKGGMDSLGNRMKSYEISYSRKLVNRMFTIIRMDGAAFHTYCKGLIKPFDKGLVDDMISTTKFLCENVQGCKLGYVQSDEISLILTDFDNITTQPWFGNELQKMCSTSASLVTSKFNQLRLKRHLENNLIEVSNYLKWRSQDAIRNSISACAQSLYSHKELHLKGGEAKQELIFQKGGKLINNLVNCGYIPVVNILNPFAEFKKKDNFNWNDVPPHLKRGTTISKQLIKKYYSNEVYEKDKRPENIKLNDGWNVEMPTPGEFDYFKMVDEWTAYPADYSSAFELLIPILKPNLVG